MRSAHNVQILDYTNMNRFDSTYLSNKDGPLFMKIQNNRLTIIDTKGTTFYSSILAPFYLADKHETFELQSSETFLLKLIPVSSTGATIPVTPKTISNMENQKNLENNYTQNISTLKKSPVLEASPKIRKFNNSTIVQAPLTFESKLKSKANNRFVRTSDHPDFIPTTPIPKINKRVSFSEHGSTISIDPPPAKMLEENICQNESKFVYESVKKPKQNIATPKSSKINNCQICSKKIVKEQEIVLVECGHIFCRPCLIKTVEYSLESVICPYFNRLSMVDCGVKFTELDLSNIFQEKTLEINNNFIPNDYNISELIDGDDDHDITNGILVETTSSADASEIKEVVPEPDPGFPCGTPDCNGWIYRANKSQFFVSCSVCELDICIHCQISHNGLNCEQYWQQQEMDDNFDGGYDQLLALEYEKCVPNVVPLTCPICLEDVAIGQGVVLHNCLHSFCRPCLQETIKYCEDVQVRCPSADTCSEYLQDREVKELSTPEIYKLYLKRSINVAKNNGNERNFQCKAPDCEGFCYLEDDQVLRFDCPACRSVNCIPCQAIHDNMTCQEYQVQEVTNGSDQNIRATGDYLQEQVRLGKAMNCPKCNSVVMKVDGCDGVLCVVCKSELCWATKGLRWGPNGKGDITGGCRCRVNGVPCAPNCQNCH